MIGCTAPVFSSVAATGYDDAPTLMLRRRLRLCDLSQPIGNDEDRFGLTFARCQREEQRCGAF